MASSNYCNQILRSRQLNPCDELYWKCRGYSGRPENWRELVYGQNESEYEDEEDSEYSEDSEYETDDYDDEEEEEDYEDDDEDYEDDYTEPPVQYTQKRWNDMLRSRQLNPCDDLYWKSRGYECRPYNWRQLVYGN